MNWLRLIRWKNLLIVFLTQLLVWYCLIYKGYQWLQTISQWIPFPSVAQRVTLLHSIPFFFCISGSTFLIAAAGYIINDYFDLKIDIINRPDKVLIEKRIPMRSAIIAHSVLNIIALGLAGFLAFWYGHYEWLLLQITCTVLLWFYSTHFKKQYIIGNVAIALLTTLTIVVLLVYSPAMYLFAGMMMHIRIGNNIDFINPFWVCISYCFFAFTTTWMREIVKDMEDFKGDAAEGCMTMPIRRGLEFSQRFAQVIGIITIIALGVISFYLFQENKFLLSGYVLLLLLLPLIAWCIFLQRRNTTEHYHAASKWLKVIMVAGICSLIVYHFTNNIH